MKTITLRIPICLLIVFLCLTGINNAVGGILDKKEKEKYDTAMDKLPLAMSNDKELQEKLDEFKKLIIKDPSNNNAILNKLKKDEKIPPFVFQFLFLSNKFMYDKTGNKEYKSFYEYYKRIIDSIIAQVNSPEEDKMVKAFLKAGTLLFNNSQLADKSK